MYPRMFLISGLKKQHDLLGELLNLLERKSQLDVEDQFLCNERTHKIERNLKKLRKLKKEYCSFLHAPEFIKIN